MAAAVAAVSCLPSALARIAMDGGSNRQQGRPLRRPPRLRMIASKSWHPKSRSADDLLKADGQKLNLLQEESSLRQKQIEKLQSELAALQTTFNELVVSNASSDAQLRSVSEQRDALSAHSRTRGTHMKQFRRNLLRCGRIATKQRATGVAETQVNELTALIMTSGASSTTTRQFLSSDRDIRELWACNLYIADVFDVDSSSRTRKPFGRVFYTRGKSSSSMHST